MKNKEPFVQAALICEKLLLEADGVRTPVRIVDRYTLAVPDNLPDGAVSVMDTTLFISLKSGAVKGESKVSIVLRRPSGATKDIVKDQKVVFKGGEHGVNLGVHLTLDVQDFGLHWFDVYWNAKRLTSIPLVLVKAEPAEPTEKPE